MTIAGRPAQRPWHFPDAGLTLLRTAPGEAPEIWCRCDAGPHGFLSIAAHAHADALSVEVRHGGVDILADPGTYCYHGEPAWRTYFRSTIAHNTIELGGQSQSAEGGPFLWLRHADSRELRVQDSGPVAEWSAEHDGYRSFTPPARHRRTVRMDRSSRKVEITDEIDGGGHDVRLAFHLGPDVEAELDGPAVTLRWPGEAAGLGAARLELPAELRWSLHRGQSDPILGWYSPGLGRRVPAWTLIGHGRSASGTTLTTQLQFLEIGTKAAPDTWPSAVRPAASVLGTGISSSQEESG
jgi:Heparinase II/III-like protein